jgi:geranylgeranyl pyrophosphate synthase
LLSDDKYEHQLKKIITKKVYNDEDYSFIADILCSSGAIEKSQKIAAAHIDKAQEYLKFIPNSQYKDLLYNFAEMLKLRNN